MQTYTIRDTGYRPVGRSHSPLELRMQNTGHILLKISVNTQNSDVKCCHSAASELLDLDLGYVPLPPAVDSQESF